MFERYGWYSHIVPENERRCNYHTHGMGESFGHLDFQLVLPIDPAVLHGLATTLVNRVKGGERFESGMRVSRVVRNYDVLLVTARESGRPVLRVILPDAAGNLEEGKLSGIFAAQYEDLRPS